MLYSLVKTAHVYFARVCCHAARISIWRVAQRSPRSPPGTRQPVPPCGRFFFNDTATTEIYTLSLHDALPIWMSVRAHADELGDQRVVVQMVAEFVRSEEHTSELQSRVDISYAVFCLKKQ